MMNSMNIQKKKIKMDTMRELLIHQQKMRKDWEDKNIILGFMKDSLKGDIEVDG